MKKMILLCLALGLFASPLMAAPRHAKEIMQHLEFLGYKAELQGSDQIKATHSEKLNIQLKDFEGGILVASYFGGKPGAGKDRAGFLEAVNRLNQGAVVARFYIDGDGDLAIEAWFPGEYDRQRFGVFLQAFDKARDNLVKNLDQIGRYIE